MDQVPEELNSVLKEIEKALAAKLYYLAIAVALSVPDICACLEFDPDNPPWANRKTYSTWCAAHLRGQFNELRGEDLYYLRCGVLHKGTFHHGNTRFDRVMFIGPESSIKVSRDQIITIDPDVRLSGRTVQELRVSGKVLMVDVVFFCRAIMNAARTWVIAKAADPYVQRNLPNLVRYRPEGLPPFSIGVPTIA